VIMALGELRQYCVGRRQMGRQGLSLLLAAVALPATRAMAATDEAQEAGAIWVEETGIASFYGSHHQGRRTAFGTRFDQRQLTAAHPWLPYGTKVRVTTVATGESVIVTVTDRLYSKHCVIDLSTAAARELGMMRSGVAKVKLTPA
jgi:rare lipoprotein A